MPTHVVVDCTHCHKRIVTTVIATDSGSILRCRHCGAGWKFSAEKVIRMLDNEFFDCPCCSRVVQKVGDILVEVVP